MMTMSTSAYATLSNLGYKWNKEKNQWIKDLTEDPGPSWTNTEMEVLKDVCKDLTLSWPEVRDAFIAKCRKFGILSTISKGAEHLRFNPIIQQKGGFLKLNTAIGRKTKAPSKDPTPPSAANNDPANNPSRDKKLPEFQGLDHATATGDTTIQWTSKGECEDFPEFPCDHCYNHAAYGKSLFKPYAPIEKEEEYDPIEEEEEEYILVEEEETDDHPKEQSLSSSSSSSSPEGQEDKNKKQKLDGDLESNVVLAIVGYCYLIDYAL